MEFDSKNLTPNFRSNPHTTYSLGEWAILINNWAISKGWNEHLAPGEQFANFHAEISEAWEEWRGGKDWKEVYYNWGLCNCGLTPEHISTLELHTPGCPATKPEGIPIELADCVIRILHTCGYYGIDLEEMIKKKMGYNETREHRHGGKKA